MDDVCLTGLYCLHKFGINPAMQNNLVRVILRNKPFKKHAFEMVSVNLTLKFTLTEFKLNNVSGYDTCAL